MVQVSVAGGLGASQGGRRQHTAAAPRPAPTGPAARGPARPAVAAAAGRQGSRFPEIGTALTARGVMRGVRVPMATIGQHRSRAPHTNPEATRSCMRAGHPAQMQPARPGTPAAAPRPLAHASCRHQPDLDESHHDTRCHARCTRSARSPGLKCQDARVGCARKQRGNAQP